MFPTAPPRETLRFSVNLTLLPSSFPSIQTSIKFRDFLEPCFRPVTFRPCKFTKVCYTAVFRVVTQRSSPLTNSYCITILVSDIPIFIDLLVDKSIPIFIDWLLREDWSLGKQLICFPRISMFPTAPPREAMRFSGNKINWFPWEQCLMPHTFLQSLDCSELRTE